MTARHEPPFDDVDLVTITTAHLGEYLDQLRQVSASTADGFFRRSVDLRISEVVDEIARRNTRETLRKDLREAEREAEQRRHIVAASVARHAGLGPGRTK